MGSSSPGPAQGSCDQGSASSEPNAAPVAAGLSTESRVPPSAVSTVAQADTPIHAFRSGVTSEPAISPPVPRPETPASYAGRSPAASRPAPQAWQPNPGSPSDQSPEVTGHLRPVSVGSSSEDATNAVE